MCINRKHLTLTWVCLGFYVLLKVPFYGREKTLVFLPNLNAVIAISNSVRVEKYCSKTLLQWQSPFLNAGSLV